MEAQYLRKSKWSKVAVLLLLGLQTAIGVTIPQSGSKGVAHAESTAVYDAQFGCITDGSGGNSQGESEIRNRIVEEAQSRVDAKVPYKWGGNDWEKGLDCSALVQQSYQRAGAGDLPRTSQEQSKKVKKIEKDQLKKGDLIFSHGGVGEAGHVAIFAGGDELIEEPDENMTAQRVKLSTYNKKDLWFGTIEIKGDSSNTGGSSSGGNMDATVEKNINDIYSFMNGKYGLSAEAIAAIIGNWKQESQVDPRTVEGHYGNGDKEIDFIKQFTDGQMGIGYGQWTAGRHTELVNWAKKYFNGEWWTTDAQLDFMFKGDGGFVAILKNYALNATDDILANTVEFHAKWEISADPPEAVLNVRGKYTKEAWEYMKAHNMTAGKDVSKINQIAGGTSGGSSGNNSSSNAGGNVEDACAKDSDDSSSGGSIGKEGKLNGKHGQVLKSMTYDQALKEYGNKITLPKFQEPNWGSSPFQGDLQGQCTELTWAYMSQLYDGKQPTLGNGGYVWESYKAQGAKVTNKPIVGYAFSALDGWLWAVGSAGHTGVVIAVFDDGSFLCANFNVPPTQAPARGVSVTLIDGVDGSDNVHFFSGIGKAKYAID